MPTKKSSDSYEVKVPSFTLSNKSLTPILVVLLIVASFYIGTLYTKVSFLEKGTDNAQAPAPTVAAAQGEPQQAPSAFTEESLNTWAKEIGLNTDQYKKCYDSKKYEKQVDEDQKVGGENGVSGTPTIFVGDQQVVGAQPFSEFQKAIDAELAKGTSTSKVDNKRLVSGEGALPIVVFSDFECPFCSRFFSEAYTQIKKDYAGKIRIVFRHFPLTNLHQMAKPAALAAECANEQGKFWEMHDKIFSSQIQ